MAHTTNHNSVGAGVTPRLGVGQPDGLARPGGRNGTQGTKIDVDIPKAARPGHGEGGAKGAGSPPKVARPGGPESGGR